MQSHNSCPTPMYPIPYPISSITDRWPEGYDGWMATIHDGWMETTEGKGGDVDESGGELNIYFTTSTYPPHISLTFSIVAGITAEVKSYVTTRGYGQG